MSNEEKVAPLSEDVLYKISHVTFPVPVPSSHTTYTLLLDSVIAGEAETPALLLRFFITLGNVVPPSRDLRYKMSLFPDVPSPHTTCTLLLEAAIDGAVENPVPLKFFIILGKEDPPSVDRLYRISKFPVVSSSQTMCTLLPDTAFAGSADNPLLPLRFYAMPGTIAGYTLDNIIRNIGRSMGTRARFGTMQLILFGIKQFLDCKSYL